MATATGLASTPEQRFALGGIGWDFHLRCCDEIRDRRVRLTFNEGKLEFMVTGSPHEFYKTMLAKLVEMIVFELNVPVRSGGSLTIQRADLQKGFEPNECWWIAGESAVRGKDELDFRTDPPPDLAVEVEMTASLANRVGIYAAIGVPELWRFDGQQLTFYSLRDHEEYEPQSTSQVFPFLRPEHLLPHVDIRSGKDETTRVREFVQWLRSEMG